jgi:glycosyltransferase involved in cell wall biosynthesis
MTAGNATLSSSPPSSVFRPPSPSVSVIICARDRPELLQRALASVLRAAALVPDTAVEVLLVDDGDELIAPEVLSDGRVQRLIGPRAGIGAARVAGLSAASGEFIAYCDVDDEWLPDHLRVLLDELRAHPEAALVCGEAIWRDDRSFARDAAPAIDRSVGSPESFPVSHIYASAVLHRASAARDVGGFDPSLHAYADVDLWLRLDEAHLLRYQPVAVTIRDRQVAGEPPDDSDERVRLQRFHHVVRPCRDNTSPRPPSSVLRPPAFRPGTWSPPRRELLWQSPLNSYQSFGLVGRQLLLAAKRAGITPILSSPPPTDDPALRHVRVSEQARGQIGFSYDYWHRPDPLPAELLVIATMREDTLVPRARINAINQTATLLYVPCRHNLDSFRECGVRVPMKVLPYGVDPALFPYLERMRSGDEPFTFGAVGALSPRKGIDVLVRAFREEFGPAEPVRLVLKSVDELPFVPPADPRIRVITGFWSHDALLRLLEEMDAFILPSRAEGFGLCGLEAMATGLPTIATNWSGPADYLDPADSLPLHYRLVDAAGMEANGVRYFGKWAEPDVTHLRSLLRWLYEHRDDAARMGMLASARVHCAWTWDRAAEQLRNDLDTLANGLSPA